MRAIVFELACAYRRTVKELKSQKARSGAERLANWLLRESRKRRDPGRFKLKIEKKVLALRLGMTPENLSRNLAFLKDHGVVADNYEINIFDFDALTEFARPSPLMDDN